MVGHSSKFQFLTVVLLAAAGSAEAATYYVDYSSGSDANNGLAKSSPWKRLPGMVGFSGTYVHSPGDRFVLRGGVTWPTATLPWTVAYSGSSASRDTYTVDETWFSGTAWSRPTLDGGGTASVGIIARSRSYFTIDQIRVINIGLARTANGKKAIDLADCQFMTLSNMRIAPETWLGVYIYTTTTGTKASVTLSGNDISNAGQAIVVATSAAGSIYRDIIIANNKIHDLSSQIGAGVHGDGIHTWGSTSDNSQYLENMKIYNNHFYGDFSLSFGTSGGMTALIYISDATEGVQIFNNIGSYKANGLRQFEAMISLRGNNGRGGRHQIFNNSFQGSTPGMSAGILLADGPTNAVPNCVIKNNILADMQFAYYVTAGSEAGLSIDYNNPYTTNDTAYYVNGFKTFVQWQSLGFDRNGTPSNPMVVSVTDPANVKLQTGSPSLGRGTNLALVCAQMQELCSDIDGVVRPLPPLPWDIGAYTGPTSPIAPPLNLTATIN